MQPAEYPIVVKWGVLLLDTFQVLVEPALTPAALAGYTPQFEIYSARGGTLLATISTGNGLTVDTVTATLSFNVLVLPPTDWPAAVPIGDYWYRMQLVQSGEPWLLFDGPLQVVA